MKEYDSLSDNEKRNMLASVANLYYNAEMTQNQIAERFFTSRSKISRMLKEARQLGIVEIKILEPWDRNVELEQEFMRRFALKDVRVISVKEANNTMVLQKLGEDLNSIMILLIPLRKLQDSLIPIFKFHYDSINSNKNLSNRSVLTDLNSIMILLILAELYNV